MQEKVCSWFYDTFTVVTRIPQLVGEVWCNGYHITLGKMQAVPAPSNFDGSHMGKGFGPEVLLAKDRDGSYLLIAPK